jgi:hypothetical protein
VKNTSWVASRRLRTCLLESPASEVMPPNYDES